MAAAVRRWKRGEFLGRLRRCGGSSWAEDRPDEAGSPADAGEGQGEGGASDSPGRFGEDGLGYGEGGAEARLRHAGGPPGGDEKFQRDGVRRRDGYDGVFVNTPAGVEESTTPLG